MLRGICRLAVAAALLWVVAARSARADGISVSTGSYVVTGAYDGVDSGSGIQDWLPWTVGPRAETDGGASASTAWSITDTQVAFSFSHANVATYHSYAITYATVDFSVASDATYALSGAYAFTDGDPGATGSARVLFSAGLSDTSTSTLLSYSSQYSETADTDTYVLGGSSGTFSSSLGSLTGTLLTGHSYQLIFQALIDNTPDDGSFDALTASGTLTLTVNPVPEPATLGLVAAGAMALVPAVRRRRRAALRS